MDNNDIDGIDITAGIIGLMVVAANIAAPVISIPVGLSVLAFYSVRRTEWFQNFVNKAPNNISPVANFLLTEPKGENSVVIRQDKPIQVEVVNREEEGFWNTITRPLPTYQNVVANAKTVTSIVEEKDMNQLVKKLLPDYISFTKMPKPPTKMSVLIGFNRQDGWMWADFDKDTIHALIAGQSGSGKDAELRLWFMLLTAQNTPDEVQFVVLDGKGEWLVPALIDSAHMLIPPVGGVDVVQENGRWVDKTNERLATAISTVFELITERNALFQKVGATNKDTYEAKTGNKLPYIFIIGTDLGTSIDKDLELLVKMLSFKGRSFGIRLIVSMQTVSGQDTGWRGNLALAMSGFQQLGSADTPVLGIPVSTMKYRPSALPSPDEPKNRGIFVVRRGAKQYIVKTAHLPEEKWEEYIETRLVSKEKWLEQNKPVELVTEPEIVIEDEDAFLAQLLQSTQKIVAPKIVDITTPKVTNPLSKEDTIRVIKLAKQGNGKKAIMKEMGWTNGDVYAKLGPFVDNLIRATKGDSQ